MACVGIPLHKLLFKARNSRLLFCLIDVLLALLTLFATGCLTTVVFRRTWFMTFYATWYGIRGSLLIFLYFYYRDLQCPTNIIGIDPSRNHLNLLSTNISTQSEREVWQMEGYAPGGTGMSEGLEYFRGSKRTIKIPFPSCFRSAVHRQL